MAVGSTVRAGSTKTSKQRPRAGPPWKGHSGQDAGAQRPDWDRLLSGHRGLSPSVWIPRDSLQGGRPRPQWAPEPLQPCRPRGEGGGGTGEGQGGDRQGLTCSCCGSGPMSQPPQTTPDSEGTPSHGLCSWDGISMWARALTPTS